MSLSVVCVTVVHTLVVGVAQHLITTAYCTVMMFYVYPSHPRASAVKSEERAVGGSTFLRSLSQIAIND